MAYRVDSVAKWLGNCPKTLCEKYFIEEARDLRKSPLSFAQSTLPPCINQCSPPRLSLRVGGGCTLVGAARWWGLGVGKWEKETMPLSLARVRV